MFLLFLIQKEFVLNLKKHWGVSEIQLVKQSPQIPEILKHLQKRDSFTLEEQHAFAHQIEANLNFNCDWFYEANPINQNSARRDSVILSGKKISIPQNSSQKIQSVDISEKTNNPIPQPEFTLEDYDRMVLFVNNALKKWDTWT